MLRNSIEKPFYPHGLNGKVFNFKKIYYQQKQIMIIKNTCLLLSASTYCVTT